MSGQRQAVRLVVAIRAGDRRAMAEFVRQYSPRLRQFAARRLSQCELAAEIEADELLHEALIELCQRASRMRAVHPEELLSYLQRTVRSRTAAIWRQRRSEPRGSCPPSFNRPPEVADTRPGPSEELELEDALAAAYERLSAEERLIALLRRAGSTWAEIAERLASSPDAVRKRWHRAVARALRSWRD